MAIIQLNQLPVQGKRKFDYRYRSDEVPHAGQIAWYRRSIEERQTVILPIASIGGKTMFTSALAMLKKMDGVRCACLFFQETALRVYYHPEQTSVPEIIETLQQLNSGACSNPNHHVDWSKVAAG